MRLQRNITDQVHSTLGEEPGRMGQVSLPGLRSDRNSPPRNARECRHRARIRSCRGEPDETALAGDRLIEPAQIQKRIRAGRCRAGFGMTTCRLPGARRRGPGAVGGSLAREGARARKRHRSRRADQEGRPRRSAPSARRQAAGSRPPSWAIATPAPVKISTPIDTIFVSLFTTLYFCV